MQKRVEVVRSPLTGADVRELPHERPLNNLGRLKTWVQQVVDRGELYAEPDTVMTGEVEALEGDEPDRDEPDGGGVGGADSDSHDSDDDDDVPLAARPNYFARAWVHKNRAAPGETKEAYLATNGQDAGLCSSGADTERRDG